MVAFKDLKFADFGLAQFQEVAFGIVKAFGGPDIKPKIVAVADDFGAMEDLFRQMTEVAALCRQAIGDGLLTNEELDGIITASKTIDGLAIVLATRIKETFGGSGPDAGAD